mmetsp:Transcript_21828/g.42945  ORF Transcript_21828/g.42945 Transcript_21828/m.42945 type:complete len:275 (+) Transcript_21828:3403-4227(+)
MHLLIFRLLTGFDVFSNLVKDTLLEAKHNLELRNILKVLPALRVLLDGNVAVEKCQKALVTVPLELSTANNFCLHLLIGLVKVKVQGPSRRRWQPDLVAHTEGLHIQAILLEDFVRLHGSVIVAGANHSKPAVVLIVVIVIVIIVIVIVVVILLIFTLVFFILVCFFVIISIFLSGILLFCRLLLLLGGSLLSQVVLAIVLHGVTVASVREAVAWAQSTNGRPEVDRRVSSADRDSRSRPSRGQRSRGWWTVDALFPSSSTDTIIPYIYHHTLE